MPSASGAPSAFPSAGPTATASATAVPTPIATASINPIPFTATLVPATGPITAFASPDQPFSFASTLAKTSTAAAFVLASVATPGGSTIPTLTKSNVTFALSATSGSTAQSLREAVTQRNDADGFNEIPQSAFADFAARARAIPSAPLDARAHVRDAARPAAFAVGATRSFSVLTGAIGGAANACTAPVGGYVCYTNITATLKAQSNHANVWVDNASLADPRQFTIAGEFTQLAQNFDGYFDTETQAFGGAFTASSVVFAQCDANGNQLPANQYAPVPDTTGADPHINIVITDALAGTGEGGYFYSGDLFAKQTMNCFGAPRYPTNELPMFIVNSNHYTAQTDYAAYNESFWLNTDMPRAISHEFQHYLHAINKYFKPIAQGGSGVLDDSFVDEGCSMLAEDIAANGVAIDTPYYSWTYLADPSDYAVTSFTGYAPDPLSTSTTPAYGTYRSTRGNYGAAYLLMRYVYDRFGGASALHRLYADLTPSPGNGRANVSPVLSAANGETWSQLVGEWSLALAAQSTGITSDPRYSFASQIVLRGTVQIPSRRISTNVRTLVFGGPQPPQLFANALPTTYLTLAPGATVQYGAIDGALNFIQPASGVGGTIGATTGVGATGGLVQGTFPQPRPTQL